MKIEYTNVNTNKLHDELIANGIIPKLVESKDDTTWVTFDDDVDMELVQQIIDAHDPTPLPQPPTLEEQLAKKDEQILELKQQQAVTNRTVEVQGASQQDLLELLIDTGVIS